MAGSSPFTFPWWQGRGAWCGSHCLSILAWAQQGLSCPLSCDPQKPCTCPLKSLNCGSFLPAVPLCAKVSTWLFSPTLLSFFHFLSASWAAQNVPSSFPDKILSWLSRGISECPGRRLCEGRVSPRAGCSLQREGSLEQVNLSIPTSLKGS